MASRAHSGFLLFLFFDPEDGGDMPLRNIGRLSTDYTALYPQRKNSSKKFILIIMLLLKIIRTM
jgi:hypothetical protein